MNVTAFHFKDRLLSAGDGGRVPGREPENGSYFAFASFTDPDGNGWLLQEITARFPGRGYSVDVPTITTLLREAEQRHGEYEPIGPKHHWSDWYAAYIVARHRGQSADEAAAAGARRVVSGLAAAVQSAGAFRQSPADYDARAVHRRLACSSARCALA